jgi:hypothetical protein
MNGEERFEVFKSSIEDWINLHGIQAVKPNPAIDEILNINRDQLRRLTHNQCLEYAYELYAYSEYLDSLLCKEQIAFDWADDSIWYVIADKIDQYGDKYTKWQEKYFKAVKENPLATQIVKVKTYSGARIKVLQNKISTIKKMSETLSSLAKRKYNE